MRIKLLFLLFSFFASDNLMSQTVATQNKTTQYMGVSFDLTILAQNDTIASAAINAAITEIKRVENLISTYDSLSQIVLINKNAGVRPVKVDAELFELVMRSKKMSKLTKGAFDISYASMDGIWKFDGSMTDIPSELKIRTASQKINWKNIILNAEAKTVFLKEKEMKIGFGGIAKGYAANRAIAVMKKIKGVSAGAINADGDLSSWGKNGNPECSIVDIAHPNDIAKKLGRLEVNNETVATSGNYDHFIEFNGKRYTPIIDPRTGYPVSGIKSVTIVCQDAEVADALATSVYILGQLEGLALVNQLVGVECLIITDTNEILGSERLKLMRNIN